MKKIKMVGWISCAVLSSFIVCANAEDSTKDALTISKFEPPIAEEWYGANPKQCPLSEESNSEYVKEGTTSGKWIPSAQPWVNLINCPKDWSGYEALSVWIYAENAIGQKINWSLASPGSNGGGDYFLYMLSVDWKGWKNVVIKLKEFEKQRDAQGLESVAGLLITSKGWGAPTPLPDAVIYFDEMRLIR